MHIRIKQGRNDQDYLTRIQVGSPMKKPVFLVVLFI